MSLKKGTNPSGKSAAAVREKSAGWTAEEKAAMKERARELKAEERSRKDRAAGEKDLLSKIAEMQGSDRAMAKRIHEIVTECAPGLAPKTWYGMPAWANDEGMAVCFFTAASKFKTRYATFSFNEDAKLDDGAMWPVAFALEELTAAGEAKIAALVRRAVG